MKLSKITDAFVELVSWIKHPYDINQGYCYVWAYIAHRLYGGELFTCDHYGGHAFVLIDGKFYDSESASLGEMSWKDLEFFDSPGASRAKNDCIRTMNIHEFVEHWAQVGGQGWDDEEVDQLLMRVESLV